MRYIKFIFNHEILREDISIHTYTLTDAKKNISILYYSIVCNVQYRIYYKYSILVEHFLVYYIIVYLYVILYKYTYECSTSLAFSLTKVKLYRLLY